MQLLFEWAGQVQTWDVRAGEIKVGTAADADLRAPAEGLARHHAVVEVDHNGRVALRPVPGRHRTAINGTQLRGPHELRASDVAELGPLRLSLRPHRATPAGPAPMTSVAWPASPIPVTSAAPTKGRILIPIMIVIAVGLAVLALVTLGPIGFVASAVVAILPAPLLVLWLRRIDQIEPEPTRLLWFAFLWGATVAVVVTVALQTPIVAALALEAGSLGEVVVGAVVLAPIIEELAKAGAVAFIMLRYRHQLNGLIDGLVYGALVGMGFAVTEDILYYGMALAEGGVGAFAALAVGRGVFSAFLHPMFSAFAGMGLALTIEVRRNRWLPPVVGLLVAMGLHALWNYAAVRAAVDGSMGFLAGVYLLVFLPVFIAFLIGARAATRREGRIVAARLRPEVERGLLRPDEVATLGDLQRRNAALAVAKHLGGDAAMRHMRELHHTAGELAFLRHRRDADPGGPHAHADAHEAALVARLLRQRASLGGPIDAA